MKKDNATNHLNRRDFIGATGSAAAASVLASVPTNVFAADDQTIRLALIGCGGRGTGAVGDALSVPESGPVKLHAAASLRIVEAGRLHQQLPEIARLRGLDRCPSRIAATSRHRCAPSGLAAPSGRVRLCLYLVKLLY